MSRLRSETSHEETWKPRGSVKIQNQFLIPIKNKRERSIKYKYGKDTSGKGVVLVDKERRGPIV